MKTELNNQEYVIKDKRTTSSDRNKDKYTKFLVTIALRLGIAIEDDGKEIILNFSGKHSEYNKHHESDNYVGTLIINDEHSIDLVKICTHNNGSSIATLWPIHKDDAKQEQSKNNQTSDFIEYYLTGGQLFTIKEIAKWYHPIFLDQPGLSPIALEKEVNAKQMHILRKLHKGEIENLIFQKEALEESVKSKDKEISNLQAEVAAMLRQPSIGKTVTKRPGKILIDVALEPMFRKNRGAVQGVVLYFDDGTSVRNNWDGGESRFATIEKLIGREVVTDVWGDYPSDEWFANVYLK